MDNCVDLDPLEFSSYDQSLTPKNNTSMASRANQFVRNLVSDNKIVIFSKTSCPHCEDSKLLLAEMGVDYKAVELDKMEEGSLVQNQLGRMTDARTVPRIFINGQCVGGNSDLKNLNSRGILKDLLIEAESEENFSHR